MADFLDECLRLKNEKVNFVIITLVSIQGSAPQNLGAKAIITHQGVEFGTIGGGKVEKTAIVHAQELLTKTENICLVKWNLQKDIGMTCGGVVELLFEKMSFESNFKVAVFGAGHVGQQLVKILSNLNCSIVVVDSRDEWLDKITNKINVTKIKSEQMALEVNHLTDDYMIVSVTMGHAFDRPILSSALKRNFKFIGVIGSEQKAYVLRNELKTLDLISETDLAKLICPVGEKFGSNDPAEIAISITAQLLKVRDHLK